MAQTQTQSWRLDRSVNVGDLLVFLSLLAAGIGFVIHQDQRSTKTEEAVKYLKSTDDRISAEVKDLKSGVEMKLDKLDAKLDRLIERRP